MGGVSSYFQERVFYGGLFCVIWIGNGVDFSNGGFCQYNCCFDFDVVQCGFFIYDENGEEIQMQNISIFVDMVGCIIGCVGFKISEICKIFGVCILIVKVGVFLFEMISGVC